MTIRRALEQCESGDCEYPEYFLKADLAYYLSELEGMNNVERAEIKSEAEQLIQEVDETAPEMSPAFKDTKGAIMISFGDENEVQDGLKICEDAMRDNQDEKELAESFYQLHQRRTWRQMLKF